MPARLDAYRHALRRGLEAHAIPAGTHAVVVDPIEAEADAHRIIEVGDEALRRELDRAAYAHTIPTTTRMTRRLERGDQDVRFELERVRRTLARNPDRRLCVRAISSAEG